MASETVLIVIIILLLFAIMRHRQRYLYVLKPEASTNKGKNGALRRYGNDPELSATIYARTGNPLPS